LIYSLVAAGDCTAETTRGKAGTEAERPPCRWGRYHREILTSVVLSKFVVRMLKADKRRHAMNREADMCSRRGEGEGCALWKAKEDSHTEWRPKKEREGRGRQ
jgi:hypothetical protein